MPEEMPKRDITGECEGECRDRVKEADEERQKKVEAEKDVEPSGESPSPPDAKKRDNPPGELGGHV